MAFETAARAHTRFDQQEYEDNGVVVLPQFLDASTGKALESRWQSLKQDSASASLERNAHSCSALCLAQSAR
jgi:hypothetical protein